MKLLILVFLIAAVVFCRAQKTDYRFPHKLWIYWHDPDLSNIPVFIQLCINNIRHYAAASGWEVVLINNDNIIQHITEQSNQKLNYLKQRIPFLYEQGLTSQALSDLFRAFLLYDNGGMWVDISSIFLRDFSWVQNLEQFELVQNSIAEQPEILMYTSDMYFGGNKTVIFDEKKQKDVYLFPGLEFWSVVAKPRTKLMKEMIEELIFLYSQKSFDSYIQEKKSQGFLFISQQLAYFSFSLIHFQVVMQRKQKQIDKNPENFKVKYAVEYYGLWTINSINSAYSIYYLYGWDMSPVIRDLVYLPFSSLSERVKKAPFIKFNGYSRKFLQETLEKAELMDCSVRDGAFNNNSFINQFLFRYNQDMPTVKKIRSLVARPNEWGQCISLNFDSVISRFYVIAVIFIIISALLSQICKKYFK